MRPIATILLTLAIATFAPQPAGAARLKLSIAPISVMRHAGKQRCPRHVNMQLDAVRIDGRKLLLGETIGPSAVLYGYGLTVYIDSRPGHRNVFRVANVTSIRHSVVVRWHYARRLSHRPTHRCPGQCHSRRSGRRTGLGS